MVTRLLLIALSSIYSSQLFSQDSLTLKECHELATQSSARIADFELNQAITDLRKLTIGNSNLPSLQLDGQISYQSDVFGFPIEFPGIEQPDIPKDWYKLNLEIRQKIYDGGLGKNQRQLAERQLEAEQQAVAVDLYAIKEIVNELYFGILLMQENEKILQTVSADLNRQLQSIVSAVGNGVLLKTDELSFRKEILAIDQQQIQLEYQKEALFHMLSGWIGLSSTDSIRLVLPKDLDLPEETNVLNRPELQLFDLQHNSLRAQADLANTNLLPKFFAFGQAGIGSPNPLDFFDTDLSAFYYIGAGLNWNIWDWGSTREEKAILATQADILWNRKAETERRIRIALSGISTELAMYDDLIAKDGQIVALQEEIVKQTFSQLENGVISSTDYLNELNAATRTLLNRNVHEIERKQMIVDYLTKSGNY